MALPFKTYATIGGTRYRIFKPKEYPDKVFAYNIEQKTAHRIDEPILKLLDINKDSFRAYGIPGVLKGMKAGQIWNDSWYKQEFADKGPAKVKVEPKKIEGQDQIKNLGGQTSFGQRSENVKKLQELLKSAGYFPTQQVATGFYGSITKKALDDFNKGQIKWPDYKSFNIQKGYALVREKDTQEVYTLDPKTGKARWLTAEAVRPAGFDLTKVTEVPKGYVGQFKVGDKWNKSKVPAKPLKQVEQAYKPGVSKYKEVKQWNFETKAQSTKAITSYIDYLKSPVSTVTAQTTPAFKLKPVEQTKTTLIENDLKDYSKITDQEKE